MLKQIRNISTITIKKLSHHIEYLDPNKSYGWTMSQKLPTSGFKWVEDLSQFNEEFIENYDENSYIG